MTRSPSTLDKLKRLVRGIVLWRFVRRLLCAHRWEPVNDWFYGSHSCFDILTKTPRRWQCCDCGKQIVTRNMPVSYVPPNKPSEPQAR